MQKNAIIKNIKAIIEKFGSFTTADVEAESSPVIATLGKDTCQLAETFNLHKVTAVTYVHETETNEDFILYEDLKKDVLEDILRLAENYEADQLKTLKRCAN